MAAFWRDVMQWYSYRHHYVNKLSIHLWINYCQNLIKLLSFGLIIVFGVHKNIWVIIRSSGVQSPSCKLLNSWLAVLVSWNLCFKIQTCLAVYLKTFQSCIMAFHYLHPTNWAGNHLGELRTTECSFAHIFLLWVNNTYLCHKHTYSRSQPQF